MYRHQPPFQPPHQPPVIIVRPRRHQPRRGYPWWILVVPLFLLFLMWASRPLHAAFSWTDIMDALNVHDRARFTRLAITGVLITVALALLRVLRGGRSG